MLSKRWLLLAAPAVVLAGLGGSFLVPLDHEAIGYNKIPTADPAILLQKELNSGTKRLTFADDGTGYLRSVLRAFDVPVESQVLVFSKTSFQAPRIAPRMPRAIYFNDDVTIGYVQTGDVVEVTSLDPKQGVIFYTLDQEETSRPRLERRDACLQCHQSPGTMGIPGLVVRSVYPEPTGYPLFQAGTKTTDHRSPVAERWGGWYVTGKQTGTHLGNQVAPDREKPESLTEIVSRFDPASYLTPYSDVAALMVLEHQTQMTNLIVRVNFEVRHALHHQRTMNQIFGDPPSARSETTSRRIREAAAELVDYLLLIEETPLKEPLEGSSGFARVFQARGPLRELDLKTRLFKVPCSYMIYSKAFDGMGEEALDAVYRRLHEVLMGKAGERYSKLSIGDRRTILTTLQKTKPGIPAYLRDAAL